MNKTYTSSPSSWARNDFRRDFAGSDFHNGLCCCWTLTSSETDARKEQPSMFGCRQDNFRADIPQDQPTDHLQLGWRDNDASDEANQTKRAATLKRNNADKRRYPQSLSAARSSAINKQRHHVLIKLSAVALLPANCDSRNGAGVHFTPAALRQMMMDANRWQLNHHVKTGHHQYITYSDAFSAICSTSILPSENDDAP